MTVRAKGSVVFSLPSSGSFSETFYANVANVDEMRSKLQTYALGRRDFIAWGVVIKGYHISILEDVPRQSDSGEWDYSRPGAFDPDLDRDVSGVGLLMKLYTGTRHSVRCFRGFPDDAVGYNSDGSIFVGSTVTAFNNWLGPKLLELGLCIRVLSNASVDTKKTPISIITTSSNTMVSVTSPGAVYEIGEQCQIIKAKGLGAGKINGVYTVLSYDAGPPAVIGLTRKDLGTNVYMPGSGFILHRVYNIDAILSSAFERFSERKVGNRVPFLQPGRRRKRA
jgi:hypothetical protein